MEKERRFIQSEAIKQAQRLAVVHDPTGASFNIGPVVTHEDGMVVSAESFRRREDRKTLAKATKAILHTGNGEATTTESASTATGLTEQQDSDPSLGNVSEDRLSMIHSAIPNKATPMGSPSKSQRRKQAALQPRSPLPRPTLPEGAVIPKGETNWIALWDLDDEELERRVNRVKRRKAADRKALRVKQQQGKVERRAARDEKRKVYRDLKLTWKSIKG